jgi:predicted transcriptional regulator
VSKATAETPAREAEAITLQEQSRRSLNNLALAAISIRRSVHRDYVVCLERGWRGQMLRRHIAGHGLSV